MRNFFKSLATLAVVSSAFLIGFYLGQEKIVSMIPDFQDNHDDHHS